MPGPVPRRDLPYRLNGICQIRPLDALTLVFHERSGQTHLVAAPIPQILQAMGAERLNAAQIAAQLAARYDLTGDADFTEIVAARLTEMAGLGLIEAMPGPFDDA